MNNWNLRLIYESREAWLKDIELLEEETKAIEALKGKLNNLEAGKAYAKHFVVACKKISSLYTYASLKHDMNQKDVKNKEDYALIYAKYNDFNARTSFVNPEILANGYQTVIDWCNDPELVNTKFNMEKLFRMEKYTKSAEVETVMANYNQATSGFNKLYDELTVVDNRSHEVKISTGEVLTINDSNFRYYLGILTNSNDRKKVFEVIYKFYYEHRNTLAAIYDGIMQAELADVKNRGFENILDSHLYHNAIDRNVFLSLIDTTKNYSAPMKKYYHLRKKYLHLDTIHTYDRFLSFAQTDKKYSYDEAKKMVLEALATMGPDFESKANEVLEEGRVSVFTTDGKATGAYSTSVYGCGTFILLNHNDQIDDAFTIAHEAGHSIHSLYSFEGQPFETCDYEIFVAEIASTFNEQLFLDYMMMHSADRNEKIVLLQQAIDGIAGTFYRQALFADYEFQAHALVEKGIPVTADALCNIMTELYAKYYDIDLNKERYKSCVWGWIPHFFHTPFYVYQYATSFSASLAFYEMVKDKKPGAFEAYINLLKSGGSDYPVNLVKKAGVDLTTTAPFMAVVKRLEELVDSLEKVLEE